MPYTSEFANPRGYEAIFEPQVLERLKTFRFTPPETEAVVSPAVALQIKPIEALEETVPLSQLTYAHAVDGSIARLEDEISFELAILKISVVKASLRRMVKASEQRGPLPPNLSEKLYEHGHNMVVLGGRGVFGDDSTEELWQDKFRLDLQTALREFYLPNSNTTLYNVIADFFPRRKTINCLACEFYRGMREKDIAIGQGPRSCPRCYRDYYPSDGLFPYWASLKDNATGVYLNLMTTLERMLVYGMLKEYGVENNLYIVDGPLAFYGPFSHLSHAMLKALQRLPAPPLIMGLEKHGAHRELASRAEVQEVLKPGHVALIPTSLTETLWGSPDSALAELYGYGKRFFYRSKNGDKTFVFMAVPQTGMPYVDKENPHADEWETYPHLKIYCEYLEAHAIDSFGLKEPAVDIIAEANHEASLPKNLSEQALRELLSIAMD